MSKYIYLLSGAKKNMGDFLIEEHTRNLLKLLRPDKEIKVIPRWLVPEDKLIQEINEDGYLVLLSGGPFYKKNIPFSSKFFQRQQEIKIPIKLMAGGSKLTSGSTQDVSSFNFSENSQAFLTEASRNSPLSTRDTLTTEALIKSGIHNVRTTGCVVWYDPQYFNQEFSRPQEVKNIVFTPSQGFNLHDFSVKLLKTVLKSFPQASIKISMNRGTQADQYTSKEEEQAVQSLIRHLQHERCEVIDTSYDLKKIDFYKQADLHIGFRVHSHLKFYSMRKPSYLINEDSRGHGANITLGPENYNPLKTSFLSWLPSFTRYRIKPLNQLETSIDYSLIDHLELQFIDDQKNAFLRWQGIGKKIDLFFESEMKPFILDL